MRGAPVLLGLGVVVLAAAWREPQMQGNPGVVNMTVICQLDGGANITVNPWRVGWSNPASRKSGQITMNLQSLGLDQKQVKITPKNATRWPFKEPLPIVVVDGTPTILKNVDQDTVKYPKGAYKYVITGVCIRSGTADTVVIDPDMIIPGL